MPLTTSWTMKKARKVFINPQHMLSSFKHPQRRRALFFINFENVLF